MKQKLLAVFLLICAVVFLSTPAMAGFTNVVTFGDSISDNGSLLNGTNAIPGDYYGFGVYSDTTPWADQLATMLGAGMFNVAYGGATTGLGNLYSPPNVGLVPADQTGLNWQVSNAGIQSVISYMPKDTTLFTVWAGANDYNRAMALGEDIAGAAVTAVTNIMTALSTLEDMGAKHILVPNLMMIDPTFTFTYNAALQAELNAFAAAFNGEIYTVDMLTLYNDQFAAAGIDPLDPLWRIKAEALGLLWSDYYHPDTVLHAAMAAAAYQAVVPEPATMMLVAFGLIGIAGVSRKKAA